jgi:L-arabinonolactonase
MNISCILQLKLPLLESILWDDLTNALWFVSIFSPSKVFCYNVQTQDLLDWCLPEVVGCIALTTSTNKIIVALASQVAILDTKSGMLTTLVPFLHDPVKLRMNDGRVDRNGNLWVGSMSAMNDYVTTTGELYCIPSSGSRKLSIMRKNISIPNSTAFSPDGNTMYWSDSKSRKILSFTLDKEVSVLLDERIFVDFAATHSPGDPDGAVCDFEGNLWVAHWNGFCISQFKPDSTLLRRLQLPFAQPTCVIFGGINLDVLYVTSSRLQDVDGDMDGCVFAIRDLQCKGFPESRFKLPTDQN